MKNTTVGIIADTHDNRTNIVKAVSVFNEQQAALVLHAGDFIAPFTVLDFRRLNCPMEMVFGNNDGERIGLSQAFQELGTLLPGPRLFTFREKRFLLMHEHTSLKALRQTSALDVIVYGHTHEPVVDPGPPLVINPGEAGGWLKGRATIALLDLDRLSVEILDLNP